MVSERHLVCEESQDIEEEDEQTDRIAKLSPTNPYVTDMLQKWVQIWHTLGADEIDINEVISQTGKGKQYITGRQVPRARFGECGKERARAKGNYAVEGC